MLRLHSVVLGMLVVALAAAASFAQTPSSPPRVLQGFETTAPFHVVTSEGVEFRLSTEAGVTGNALRVDYEFVAGGGFGIVQFPVPLDLPAPEAGDFEFAFKVRGEGTPNALEFKLLDVGGDLALNAEKADVWWVNRRDFVSPVEWTTIHQKRRHVTFAWGPKGGSHPSHVDKIEFAIASVNGGKGTLWLDDLTFRTIAPPPSPLPETKFRVSVAGGAPVSATLPIGLADGETPTEVTIDFGYERDVDYLLADFAMPLSGGGVSIEVFASTADAPMRLVTRYASRGSIRQDCVLPDISASALKLRFITDSRGRMSLMRLGVPEAGIGSNMNLLATQWARSRPELYPRYFRDEQAYWTVVGLPGSPNEVLVSDEGTVEIGDRAYSIEPWLQFKEDALPGDHNDVYTPHSFACEHLPTLEVDGSVSVESFYYEGVSLHTHVRVVASPDGGEDAVITYTFKQPDDGTSFVFGLRVLPFQVSPPWQFLNMKSGVGSIRSLRRTEAGLLINEDQEITVQPAVPFQGLETFDDCEWYFPRRPRFSGESGLAVIGDRVECPRGMGSAIAGVRLPWTTGGDAHTYTVTVPLPATPKQLHPHPLTNPSPRPVVHVPAAQQPLIDTLNANLNYIMVNADGPAIQPGSRCYERSWIRDGALTSSALLSFGQAQQAVDFIDWYATFLIPIDDDALKVPCVVDRRGADPVPENDSHGEYIFAVWNAYEYTKDLSILERHWPNVQKVLTYIDQLTAQRSTKEFGPDGPPRQEPGKPAVPAWAFSGIMPESISHEGYSAKPMHSYWDNWFTWRGLQDAARIAEALGHFDDGKKIAHRALLFRGSLLNSIALTMEAHNIDYIPSCVELGDFDSTSTTIAIWPGGAYETTGSQLEFQATFERYWEFFQHRAATNEWEAFTPYELRHVGVYVRLGQPDRANAVLDWLMNYQRPKGWHQWAEVVWNDPATPKFIGDMPHTWCGSDFINSFRAMLAYESDDDTALHLFAGLSAAWFATPEATSITNLPTHFGPVNARIAAEPVSGGSRVVCTIEGPCAPPKGFVLRAPTIAGTLTSVTINGAATKPEASGTITASSSPTTIVWTFSSP